MEIRKIKLRILFFTQYFYPENFRINELVNFFCKENDDVTVLTTNPSYPNKDIFKKKQKKIKYGNKLKIIRIPSYKRYFSNFSIFLNYITFFFNSFILGSFKIINKKFDLIFIFAPSPILTILPIILLNKLIKKKVVLWVLDLWPDTIIDLGYVKNKILKIILTKIINYIYNNSDLILAQSDSIRNEIKKRTKSKCIYFPSWPEESILKKKIRSINKIKKIHKKIQKIIFAGNIGEAQSLENLVNAVKLLNVKKNFIFILIGDGRWKKRIINLTIRLNIEEKFIFLKQVPNESIGFFLKEADAFYLSLKKNKTFSKTIPGKLQTYMSLSKPILASISGETYNIIKKSKCGFVSKADNKFKLAKNITFFLKLNKKTKTKIGKNGKIYANKYFKKINILNNLRNEMYNLVQE